MELKSKIAALKSREDLAKFIGELRNDLIHNPNEWINGNLNDFLEGLSAWIQDMDGYYQNNGQETPLNPSWKNIAEMLIAAKYYE